MDYFIGIIFVGTVVYVVALSNGRAPSPLTLIRHGLRRSDMGDTEDEGQGGGVVSDLREPGDPENFVRLVSSDSLRGPRPIDELLGPDVAKPAGVDAVKSRREWVAARMDDGWSPGRIDTTGADAFGVSEKTIERDRSYVRLTRGAS